MSTISAIHWDCMMVVNTCWIRKWSTRDVEAFGLRNKKTRMRQTAVQKSDAERREYMSQTMEQKVRKSEQEKVACKALVHQWKLEA